MTDQAIQKLVEAWLDQAVGLTFSIALYRGAAWRDRGGCAPGLAPCNRRRSGGSKPLCPCGSSIYLDRLPIARDGPVERAVLDKAHLGSL